MKKFLVLSLCLAITASFFAGCGKQETQEPANTPAAGNVEEMADSTRLDSAAAAAEGAVEGAIQEGEAVVDSAAAAVEGAVEGAVEEGAGAVEEAAEGATEGGH